MKKVVLLCLFLLMPVAFQAVELDEPRDYCEDSDGFDIYTAGEITFAYWSRSGEYTLETLKDTCFAGMDEVESCRAGTDCMVIEYTCVEGEGSRYEYDGYMCWGGCRDGACQRENKPYSWLLTEVRIERNSYEGAIQGGAAEGDYELRSVELSIMRDSDRAYWNGSEWTQGEEWLLASGLEEWRYAIAFEDFNVGWHTIHTRATDSQGNTETVLTGEYIYVVEWQDANAELPMLETGLPEKVSDQALLQYIEYWARGELGETAEENDSLIMQLVEVWKKS